MATEVQHTAAIGWTMFAAAVMIVVVTVNMIGQFAFFPAYPLWGVVAIGLSLAVLWALTLGWRDVREGMGA